MSSNTVEEILSSCTQIEQKVATMLRIAGETINLLSDIDNSGSEQHSDTILQHAQTYYRLVREIRDAMRMHISQLEDHRPYENSAYVERMEYRAALARIEAVRVLLDAK
eukprot:TRINITY_DN5224_c0_g1_i3.p1 TRINITY_DN5224_c0_g1~~TRINITY_DN5224_c0_g1_i3.p1  ORF type:complete len:109 (-),score=7.27 TRINITY_DN5224_c0_g1_i3:163-489(-)